jgi:hypothetical protein
MLKVRVVLLASGSALLLTSAAFAQAQDPREIEARKDCLVGQVEAGAAILAGLFAETGNPNFIYNQARCYEQNSRPDEAISRFREYLRVAGNLGAEEKADVERHIAECRGMQAELEQRQRNAAPALPAAPLPPPPNAVPPAAWPAVAQPPLPTTPAGYPPPADAMVAMPSTPAAPPVGSDSGLRTWGIVVGSVGVAAVGAGVAFSLLTKSTQGQVESDGRRNVFDPDKYSRGQTYASLQWVGYGVGAVAIAAGALMMFARGTTSQPGGGQQLALVPAVGSGQAGLSLQGGF